MKQIKTQQKILISACLLGSKVRYNSTDLLIKHPLIKKWQQEGRLVPICPEVAGGMSIPRAPAEIINGTGQQVITGKAQVINNIQQNVTKEFILGAQEALKLAKENNCIAAIFTERSPSCGSSQIYDGSFLGKRIEGVGVTSALLIQHKIKVFNQHELELLVNTLNIS